MSDEQDIAALNDLLVGVEMDRHSLPDGNAKVEALGRAIARLRGDAQAEQPNEAETIQLVRDRFHTFVMVNGTLGHSLSKDGNAYFAGHPPAATSAPAAPEMPPGKPFVDEAVIRRIEGLARRWDESANSDKSDSRRAAKRKCAADLRALTAALAQDRISQENW